MAYPIGALRDLLIKEGKSLSLNDFKEKLSLGDKDDNTLCKVFCLLLETDINNLKYENSVESYAYLSTLIEYISTIFNKGLDVTLDSAFIKLDEVLNLLKKERIKLTEKDNNITWTIFIGELIKKTYYSISCLRNCQKNKGADKEYTFLSTLVYETRDIYMLEGILDFIPDIVNAKNEKGESFFEQLVIRYLKEIRNFKLDDNNKILYYDYLINAFLSSPQIVLNGLRKKLSGKASTTIQSIINSSAYSKLEKNEIRFFLQNIHSNIKNNNIGNIYDIEDLNRKFGKSFTFSDTVISEAMNLKGNDIYDIPTVDLTHLNTISIDKAGTSIIDDAISFEVLPNGNDCIYIHGANVCRYIKRNSKIELEALKRGETLYLNDRVIPMFPDQVDSRLCSLFMGFKKQALTCRIEIDKQGEVVNHQIMNSLIKVKNNMSYESADKVLNEGDTSSPLFNTLRGLYDVSCLIKPQLDRDYFSSSLTGPLKTQGVRIREYIPNIYNNGSHDIIKYFLALANYLGTKDLLSKNLPCLGKEMELDTVFKLSRELKEAWELFGRQKDIYPHLIKNAVDFKLDRKTYSDRVSANGGCFTKPMRCFSAFITQRMLIEFLLSDKVDDKLVYYYEAYLKEIAQQLTATQMRNIEYSLSYNRIKRKII